jgi:DNA-binding beta-propeller fold protein YncE
VYVSDAGNRRIQKFDGNGKFLCQFGKKGSGEAILGRPGGIAVDLAGNIYVVDRQSHRVKKYAPQN